MLLLLCSGERSPSSRPAGAAVVGVDELVVLITGHVVGVQGLELLLDGEDEAVVLVL